MNLKAGLTPPKKRMPQTAEEWAYLADHYEQALTREKLENSKLRSRINILEQKS